MILQRIYRLLNPEERKKGVRIVGAVFLSALLDFAGLAALLPILYLVLDGGGEDRTRAVLFCVGALVFIGLKNALVALLSHLRMSYLLSLYRRISLSLFSSYCRRGLLFIRQRGSIRLGYEVNYVCFNFALYLLAPLLTIAGEGLLILLVTAALIVYSPLTTLLLYAAFLPFGLAYAVVVKGHIRRYGERELQARREQSRLVTESLKGFPELELNGAFPLLTESFGAGMKTICDARLKLNTVERLPLFLCETAIVLGLTLLVAWGEGDVKALIGVFAVAAFRLLPALRSVLGGWTLAQNASSCLNIIEEGVMSPESAQEAEETSAILPFEKEICADHLSFAYPGGDWVLKDFCCTIRKGEYVGFRGESGIGKSTLFNLLLGLLTPGEGQVTVDGTPINDKTRKAWHRRVSYVQQEVFILDDSVARNVALGFQGVDRKRVADCLRQVCMSTWVEQLPEGIDTLLGEGGSRLSGGQKQRIGLARALYKGADVILLDEATSSLDNDTEDAINQMMLTLMRENPRLTVLTIAHRERSLIHCQRIVELHSK